MTVPIRKLAGGTVFAYDGSLYLLNSTAHSMPLFGFPSELPSYEQVVAKCSKEDHRYYVAYEKMGGVFQKEMNRYFAESTLVEVKSDSQ